MYLNVPNSNQSNNGGYGMGRGRGGGGGGMGVLSRPRSSHKAASKLSVPPPLNLPSLRKEHQKFDTLGAGGGAGGGTGGGARPSSSGIGWSKTSAILVVDSGDRPLSREGVQANDGVSRGGNSSTSAYLPPSARVAVIGGGGGGDGSVPPPVEKVSVLRGEEFPSLRATLNAPSGPNQKQKDSGHHKLRHVNEDAPGGCGEVSQKDSGFQVAMRPQVRSPQPSVERGTGGDSQNGSNSRPQEQSRKNDDYFPDPLPLVRLSPRSDWADDERDTSHGLNNNKEHGYSRTEAYWERDFDFPRNNYLPHKPAHYQFDRRGQRNDDVGKGLSNEVSADNVFRDGRAPSRYGSQDVVNNINNLGARPTSGNTEMNKDNNYNPRQFGGTTRNEHNNGGFTASDLGTGRRDQGYMNNGRQPWNNSADPNNGDDRKYELRYVNDSNRYRDTPFRNSMGARPAFSASNKGFSASYHLPNFSRENHSFSIGGKPYLEDPFMGSDDFDGKDHFSGGILGVVKRKKDANINLHFHDPVRESFEAELERVQQIQEQERLRVIEEQEKAMEMARREEEERLRKIREQEDRQRRLEQETREAAWRVEQEKVEVMRKAEELKIAKEKERQTMMMEDERRKQAAKQKLLELEEKIARRQAESSKADSSSANSGDIMTGTVKERNLSRPEDFASWEDGERMVERITNSASSDSSLSRPHDLRPRAVSDRDASFAFTDRGKSFNSWRRDVFDNGNNSSFFSVEHDNAHLSPGLEAPLGGRSFPRKDFYGGQEYMPTSGHYQEGALEPHMDDFPRARGNRWNMEFEADFHENVSDRINVGWGQGNVQGRGCGYTPFPDRLYENSDLDEFYSYERSRYPARQPRVLPPPVHRTSFRSESGCLGSPYKDALQAASTTGNHQNDREENLDNIDLQEQRTTNEEQELNKRSALGCDSQSSLSVSSPPSSPTQLSHDDFDGSRESLAVAGVGEGEDILENEVSDLIEKKRNTLTTTSSLSVGDDEGWSVENIEVPQDQEDCDEYVGYHVENELHGGKGESCELIREFEEMHLEEKGSSDMVDNLVLGFDQGVEVGIPIDDHDKSAMIDDNLSAGTQGTVGAMQQNESFDSSCDAENALKDYVPESNNASARNPISLVPSAGDSSASSVHCHQSVPSLSKTDSHESNHAVPRIAGAQVPTELPNLQFGLFSGPSLIPSPVPSIQIGSIQMPLQLHPHIGPPLPHMHASQPALFQFGQLRYPTPMSQGIVSLAPQPMSCVQPNVSHNFPSGEAPKGPLTVQDSSSHSSVINNGSRSMMNNHPIQPSNQLNAAQETELKEGNSKHGARRKFLSHENRVEASCFSADTVKPQVSQRTDNFVRNSKPFNKRVSEIRPRDRSSSFGSSGVRYSGGLTSQKFSYSSRNPDARLTSPANDGAHSDGNVYQRRPRLVTQRFEFRVRQTADGKQFGLEAQSKSGLNKETISVIGEDKSAGKFSAGDDGPETSLLPEGSLKRNVSSQDHVDAPLQSGVVRIYQQPGIEAPSDEDDFIEVRSKRQMLNDRREQREKESKAKSSNMKKVKRKSRPSPQGPSGARTISRASNKSNPQAVRSTHVAVASKRRLPNNEVSQPLVVVGSGSLSSSSLTNAESLAMKPVETSPSIAAKPNVCAYNLELTLDGPRKVDGVQSTLGSWGGSCRNPSVMTLTQTQLEEAMKRATFDTNIVSVGNQTSSVGEPTTSSVSKATSFMSASPINSLLAGAKIQFGAVTSPTAIPPSTHVVSQGIRPVVLSSLDIRTSESMSTSKNNFDILFEKEKHLNESCRPLGTFGAEAEAAASAIAVAAFGNSEVAGDGIGGISGDQHRVSQPKADETLSVSLPADLSVETPPISIWPPLPSPHRFPGGPTSHFLFYDMNPMMGGPVFAFGPTDESAGSPSHPQKNVAPSSGPLGTWQQCLTGVDTLYGPAGFTAPFLNAPSTIPGVQGAPHMVVYNHFTSVGQLGQVGLSYMGTTYVPSGKQPDWKHNPTSTAMNIAEGETNSVNMVPVMRNASNVPAQVPPHLAPGSPLLPTSSPVATYEVPPFQSAPDMSVHPRWSHVQTPPVHTVPQSMPLQHQPAVTLPSQFDHGTSDHPSSSTNRFSKPPTSTLIDGSSFTQLTTDPLGSDSSTPNSSRKDRFEDSSRTEPVAASKRNSQAPLPAHQGNPSGQQHYTHYQRPAGQKNGSGADWSSRKMGFCGRNHSSGGERSFPPTKVKQIYVAKQSTSGPPTDV